MDALSKLSIIPFDEILAAKKTAPSEIRDTPLVKLNLDVPNKEIYLKLENLQPVGSFKIRGAFNALVNRKHTTDGVFTSSAGNFAQGLAWAAAKRNIKCDVVVPDTASPLKIEAIKRYGGNVIKVPYNAWWSVMMSEKYDGLHGSFIHPCCDRSVIAGNGVIGFEIIEALPDVDAIVCSYGGGGHSLGISSAVKHVNPHVKVYACEAETAAPLSASLAAGKAVVLEKHKPSFVDGMNGKAMFPCMWNLAKHLLDGAIITTLREICDALKLLVANNHIVSEGAGAATVAAALSESVPNGKIVCVISGGNIDLERLKIILSDEIPD